MKVRYYKKGNTFWGIQDADKALGKNLGWIKIKKAPKERNGKDCNLYLVKIQKAQWPHPGNRLVKAGVLTNYKSFWSLKEAKNFVEEYYEAETA
tara:strand:+ start:65 stop:346 length:282 start_codon:yes stop_codon:yes gene_type:complete